MRWTSLNHRLNKIKAEWSTFIAKIMLKSDGASIGSGFVSRGVPCVRCDGKIIIKDDVHINSAVWANPIGSRGKTQIKVFPKGTLILGNRVGMSSAAIVSASCIELEDDVMLGIGVRVYDTDFHPKEPRFRYGPERDDNKAKTVPVKICEGAFIGADAMILKGVTVGRRAIVGAGSIVADSIPEYEIWAGNPAVKIGEVDRES